jgi:arylsulfatase A-like enzyme
MTLPSSFSARMPSGPAKGAPALAAAFAALTLLFAGLGCQGSAPMTNDSDAAAAASAEGKQQPDTERPNVLFVLVDDLGYMDVGAYNPGTFYETPHIDSLARRSATFVNGYAANPVCSPTRYSIMAGRYPTRENHTEWFCGKRMTGRFRPAAVDCSMAPSQFTMAEAFAEGGYATWFGGKWHLGDAPRYWPKEQGFDVNVGGFTAGNPSGFGGYFSPWDQPRLQVQEEGKYLPRHLAGEAVEFIGEQSAEGQPFFTYLSFYEVHTPLQAPDSLVAKYERKRERLGLGAVDEYAGVEQVWPDAGPRRVRVVQGDPEYAAMVEEMDRAVGTVLDALEKNDVADNTVVVFMSDNGGLSTAQGHPTSNRPLRGGKGWLYEGGIREPYIIHWPGVTEAGTRPEIPAISMDFYPTLLDIAGLPARPQQHVDGESLVPVLRDENDRDALGREALYWHYPHYADQGGFPGGAVRMGDWKLIENVENGEIQLFNLAENPGEHRRGGQATEHPERAERMRERLHAWYDEVGARFLRPKEEGGPEPWQPPAR